MLGDLKQVVRPLATGNDPALKRSFRGHKDAITSVAFNPNLKQVASSSLDNTVIVWNFKPQQRPFKFVGHKGAVHDVAFSPNGNMIASCSKDTTVRLWNNSVEGHSSIIKAHVAGIRSVNFSCDGKLLLTGSDDKTMKIFNVSDRRFLSAFTGHSNWIKSAQFSPDVRLIGSGSDDKTVKIWDVDQKQEIHTFYDHTGVINTVKFHPDGTCIASGSHDKKIKIWDIRSKRLVQHYDAHADNVNQISFHPSGFYLVSASNDAKLKIWDLRQGRLAYTLYGHEGSTTSCSFSEGGDFFVSGGSDNIVMVWKSNFEEVSNEYIEDLLDVRPSSAGYTSGKSNKRLQVKESRVFSPSNKIETRSEIKEMTFSPPKTSQKKEIVKKTNEFQYSIRDKTFIGSSITNKDEEARDALPTNYPSVQVQSNIQNQTFDMNKLPEVLSSTMDKIVNQLDIITKTLQVLEMRIGVNEEQIRHLSGVVNSSKGANLNILYTHTNANENLEDSRQKMQQSVKISENVFNTGALQQTTGTLTPTLFQQSTNMISTQNFASSTFAQTTLKQE